jgi:hypothetical protein
MLPRPWLLLIVTAVFGLIIVACEADEGTEDGELIEDEPIAAADEDDDPDERTREPTPIAEANRHQVGETVQLQDGAIITLHEVRLIDEPRYEDPTESDTYGFDLELCAGSAVAGPVPAEPFSFRVRMPDNTLTNPNLGEHNPQFIRSELTAGECNRGWVTFTVDNDARPTLLLYDLTYNDQTANVRWDVSGD